MGWNQVLILYKTDINIVYKILMCSAGVVVTLLLPHLTPTTTKLSSLPALTAHPHGHTGHVRFLTCVEMGPGRLGGAGQARILVISGGDGYEDFGGCGASELAGREDSTNHLLLWTV